MNDMIESKINKRSRSVAITESRTLWMTACASSSSAKMNDMIENKINKRSRLVAITESRILWMTASSSSAMLLTEDMVIEILCRLPTKSLSRFRCVSKPWNCSIAYVFSHRTIHLPMSGLLFYTRHRSPAHSVYSSLPSHPNHHFQFASRLSSLPFHSTCSVIHCCNGLLLFTNWQINPTTSIYYVWNPATMELVALPDRHGYSVCYLAFDPRRSPHYKAVRFTLSDSCTWVIASIYSSVTGSWADEVFTAPCTYLVNLDAWDHNSVFHQGALYMLAEDDHIARFDVDNPTLHLVKLPEKRTILRPFPCMIACIGESRGRLYYAVFHDFQLRIYMLLHEHDDTISEEWQLTHEMSTEFLVHHPSTREPAADQPSRFLHPIAFHPESEVIYLSTKRKILSYDPSINGDDRLKEVCSFVPQRDTVDWLNVFPVVPCLESINPPGCTLYQQPVCSGVN